MFHYCFFQVINFEKTRLRLQEKKRTKSRDKSVWSRDTVYVHICIWNDNLNESFNKSTSIKVELIFHSYFLVSLASFVLTFISVVYIWFLFSATAPSSVMSTIKIMETNERPKTGEVGTFIPAPPLPYYISWYFKTASLKDCGHIQNGSHVDSSG